MAGENVALGPTIIGGYQRLHLDVIRLKYVLLKVAGRIPAAGRG